MKIRSLLAVGLIILFSGCATQDSLHPQALVGQDSIYNSGTEIIRSEKENVVVLAYDYQQLHGSGRADLSIAVRNKTNTPIDFSTDNVTVKTDKQNLTVYSYQELAAEIEQQPIADAFMAALGAMSNSLNASGNNNVYRTYSGSSTATYHGTTYNPYLAMKAKSEANAQTQRDVERIKQNYNSNMAWICRNILRRNTVFPNNVYAGVVRFDLPNNAQEEKIYLHILFGNETHSFQVKIIPNTFKKNSDNDVSNSRR